MTYDLPKGTTALFVALEKQPAKDCFCVEIREPNEIWGFADDYEIKLDEIPFDLGDTIQTTQGKRVVESIEVKKAKELVKEQWCDDGGESPGRYIYFSFATKDGFGHETKQKAVDEFSGHSLDSWGIYCQLKELEG